MGEVSIQSQTMAIHKAGNVVLDIESLPHHPDRCCSGNQKMTVSKPALKALSRKGSSRMERQSGDEQQTDDASKKLIIKVIPSQVDQLKQTLVPIRTLTITPSPVNSPRLTETGDGRNRRFTHIMAIHPKKILLFFATLSSMGTIILIYFTLAIHWRGGA